MKALTGILAGAALMMSASMAFAGGAGTGSFTGLSNHVTKGEVSVVKTDAGWEVHLKDSFWFDGAPDPHVALGNNGYDKNASLALLSSNNGKQVYAIPASMDVADFNEIWIWCNKFAVPLGVAKLSLT